MKAFLKTMWNDIGLWLVVVFLMVVLVLFAVKLADERKLDATDDRIAGVRSGMRLYTDHETKCQYLGARNSGLTPRLDAQGKHMCGSKGVLP